MGDRPLFGNGHARNTAGVVPSGADLDSATGEPDAAARHGRIIVTVADAAAAERAQGGDAAGGTPLSALAAIALAAVAVAPPCPAPTIRRSAATPASGAQRRPIGGRTRATHAADRGSRR
jgi:hypothetical protein